MRLVASTLVAFFFVELGVCGSSGDKLFDFPSPPSGSTCQQVIDYVNAKIPPEGRSIDGMRFYTNFPPDLGGGVQADFVVEVIKPENRDRFLDRNKSTDDRLEGCLAPSVLGLPPFQPTSYAAQV